MRRWLPRTLWLLAWSGWAWLGCGLFKELPRQFGPTVCELNLGAEEYVIGFLVGEHQLVTDEVKVDGQPVVVRILDAKSGRIVREMEGGVGSKSQFSQWFSRRHPWMIGLRAVEVIRPLAPAPP